MDRPPYLLAPLVFAVAAALVACPGGKSPGTPGVPSPVPTVIVSPRPVPSPTPSSSPAPTPQPSPTSNPKRGFPQAGPWLDYTGSATALGDLGHVAGAFKIVVVDADPSAGLFTKDQLQALSKGGANRVLSRLSVCAVASTRAYWSTAPAPLKPASALAHLGHVDGTANETWIDPTDAGWRPLLVNYIAKRLVDAGVDGLVLDRLELLEHLPDAPSAPCTAACQQAGLGLVASLRKTYPDLLLVVRDATGDVIRLSSAGPDRVSDMLDGVVHDNVFAPTKDDLAERELQQWAGMGLAPGGRPFWIGTSDTVGACTDADAARADYTAARTDGFSPYAGAGTGPVPAVCYWNF